MTRGNKDAAPSLPTRNYTYKVKSVLGGDREIRDLNDQFYHAHRYANALIAIERRRRQEVQAVIAAFDPEIPRLEAVAEAAERAIEDRKASIRVRAQAGRKRARADDGELAAFAEMKAAKAGAFAELKARKAVAYADPGVQGDLAPIRAKAFQDNKDAYRDSGAFWGTKLAVARSLEGIGAGAPPAFRPWGLDGAIAVQIQKGMDWATLLSCEDSRARLQSPCPPELRPTHGKKSGAFLPPPDPDSRRSRDHGLSLLHIRIGTAADGRSPLWARALVHIDRQPPADARVKWVYLQRRLVGRQVKWSVRFALSRESWDVERGGHGSVGVEIGWRMTPGGMRVATAVGSDGERRDLVIPDEEAERWRMADGLRSRRDGNFNAIRDALAAWLGADAGRRRALVAALLEGDRPKAKLADSVPHLSRWESPDKLQELAWWWKDRRVAGDRDVHPPMMEWRRGHEDLTAALGPEPLCVYDELHAWRRQDRHLHDWQDNQRSKAIRWRDELYWRFAAILSRNYRTVRLKKIDWKEIKELDRDVTKDRDPGPGRPRRCTNFQVAAPGSLQRRIVEKFGKDRVSVVPAKDLARRCHACGSVEAVGATSGPDHACSRCGARWDLGVNEATNILGASIAEES